MIQRFYKILQPFKFRLTVFGLLSVASIISMFLFRARVSISGQTEYAFLIWNLFLAWIPLGIAYIASSLVQKRRHILILLPLVLIPWLLFLPNAPYIVTDLLHLKHPRVGVPIWFDVLMISWFAWTGMLLGVFSLFMMHDIIRRILGRWVGWGFVLITGLLTSLGIYIGRFLRWNSWDLILNPFEKLNQFIYYATHPSTQSIMFIGVFSMFFLFIYITLYAFGLLFQEQSPYTTKETL